MVGMFQWQPEAWTSQPGCASPNISFASKSATMTDRFRPDWKLYRKTAFRPLLTLGPTQCRLRAEAQRRSTTGCSTVRSRLPSQSPGPTGDRFLLAPHSALMVKLGPTASR